MSRLTAEALAAPGGLLDAGSRLVRTLIEVPARRAAQEQQDEQRQQRLQVGVLGDAVSGIDRKIQALDAPAPGARGGGGGRLSVPGVDPLDVAKLRSSLARALIGNQGIGPEIKGTDVAALAEQARTLQESLHEGLLQGGTEQFTQDPDPDRTAAVQRLQDQRNRLQDQLFELVGLDPLARSAVSPEEGAQEAPVRGPVLGPEEPPPPGPGPSLAVPGSDPPEDRAGNERLVPGRDVIDAVTSTTERVREPDEAGADTLMDAALRDPRSRLETAGVVRAEADTALGLMEATGTAPEERADAIRAAVELALIQEGAPQDEAAAAATAIPTSEIKRLGELSREAVGLALASPASPVSTKLFGDPALNRDIRTKILDHFVRDHVRSFVERRAKELREETPPFQRPDPERLMVPEELDTLGPSVGDFLRAQ